MLLLEAGGDPRELRGGDPLDGDPARLPDDYDVPAFHGLASENEALAWNFYVKHHDDEAANRRDPKFVRRGGPDEDGILYPRAAALGGCTAHNAMIWVYPHDADWDAIATATGDGTWSAASMRRLFQKIENCRHRPVHRWLGAPRVTGHGSRLARMAARRARRAVGGPHRQAAAARCDPGRTRGHARDTQSDGSPPLVLHRLVRSQRPAPGPRQRHRHSLRAAHNRGSTVESVRASDCWRCGTGFPTSSPSSSGRWSRACCWTTSGGRTGSSSGAVHGCTARMSRLASAAGELGEAHAAREVILSGRCVQHTAAVDALGHRPAGGVAQTRHHRHGWRCRAWAATCRTATRSASSREWTSPSGGSSAAPPSGVAMPPTAAGTDGGRGLYATNGAVLTMFTRSTVADALPDLFVMAMVARFEGYAPSYSASLGTDRNFLTWVVLEGAHEEHRRRGDAEERRTPAIPRASTSASGWTAAPTTCGRSPTACGSCDG